MAILTRTLLQTNNSCFAIWRWKFADLFRKGQKGGQVSHVKINPAPLGPDQLQCQRHSATSVPTSFQPFLNDLLQPHLQHNLPRRIQSQVRHDRPDGTAFAMVTTRRGASSSPTPGLPTTPRKRITNAPRSSPYLPTPLERVGLLIFPTILLFGTIFSILSPETRSAPYDPVSQSHAQDPKVAPNYFARKSNLFNVVFVKQGWGWMSLAFAVFVLTHPGLATNARKIKAGVRWTIVTGWWFLVTQWCFGPAIIDRGFRWTGGKCEFAEREVEMGDTSLGEMVTSVACKAAGGRWKGGHDISGHVFLLVLSTAFLMEEVGWVVLRWSGWSNEERAVVMDDGATKGAGVEADAQAGQGKSEAWLGIGGKVTGAVVALNLWMLLMTAIYFHTWFEKVSYHVPDPRLKLR